MAYRVTPEENGNSIHHQLLSLDKDLEHDDDHSQTSDMMDHIPMPDEHLSLEITNRSTSRRQPVAWYQMTIEQWKQYLLDKSEKIHEAEDKSVEYNTIATIKHISQYQFGLVPSKLTFDNTIRPLCITKNQTLWVYEENNGIQLIRDDQIVGKIHLDEFDPQGLYDENEIGGFVAQPIAIAN